MSDLTPAAPDDTRTGSRTVKPFELFFDLVFVFAFTQVTQYMAKHPTWEGLGQGMLLLLVMWWSWVAYSWLATTIDLDEGAIRIAIVVVMGGFVVMGMAVPEAFGDHSLHFALAYIFVRFMHLVIYSYAAVKHEHENLFSQVMQLVPSATIGPLLILIGATIGSENWYTWWIAGIVIDYGGALFISTQDWVVSPHHFAERHGLILIVALGEAIISIGAGAKGLDLTDGVVLAAMLGYAAIVSVWWMYFDVQAIAAERVMGLAKPDKRAALARDGYSYAHFLLVGGMVYFALGVKKAMAHPFEPLSDIGTASLYGGLAMVVIGLQLLRLRFIKSVSKDRLFATVALPVLAFVPMSYSAMTSLVIAAAIMVGTVTVERIRFAEMRAKLRSGEVQYLGHDDSADGQD